VFDEDETNTRVLDVAYRFGEWIIDNFEANALLLDLNRIQIEKRQNKLLKITDIQKLDIISKNDDIVHKFAALTLLDEPDKAKQCLKEMDSSTRKLLETWPIYTLYEKQHTLN
jgi:hypothetical protein